MSWHPATDNLDGTDVYGVFDNDLQSLTAWSRRFDNVLESDGSTLFMFSNGDCTEWMVVENTQFNTQFGSNIDRFIIASHYGTNYYSKWHNRGIAQDPVITWGDSLIYTSLELDTKLYSEANNSHNTQRISNNFSNVWIS